MEKLLYLIVFIVLLVSCQQLERKKIYYQNGKLKMDSYYENGIKNGVELVYDSLGRLLVENSYVNDTIVRRTMFYVDRKTKRIENFNKGILDGEIFDFYPNGNVQGKGDYKRGKPFGIFFQYYENDSGKVLREAYFVNVKGHPQQYYVKSFDSKGNSKDEYRSIDIVIKPQYPTLGDTISVDFLFRTNVTYDYAKIVIGDFDDQFNPNSKLDTLKIIDGKAHFKFVAEADGLQYLRGEFHIYKKEIYRDSTVEYSSLRYFEEKIMVVHH